MLVQPLFQAVQQVVHFDKVITTQPEFEEALKSSDTYPNGVLIDGNNLTFSNHIGSLDGGSTGILVFSRRTKISCDLTVTEGNNAVFKNFGQVYSFGGGLYLKSSTNSSASGYCCLFYSCKNLYNIRVLIVSTYTTSINYASLSGVSVFYSCYNLINSGVEGQVDMENTKKFIGFYNCTDLIGCCVNYNTLENNDCYGFYQCSRLSNCYGGGGFKICRNVSLSCSGTMSGCIGEIPEGYVISCKGQINS